MFDKVHSQMQQTVENEPKIHVVYEQNLPLTFLSFWLLFEGQYLALAARVRLSQRDRSLPLQLGTRRTQRGIQRVNIFAAAVHQRVVAGLDVHR